MQKTTNIDGQIEQVQRRATKIVKRHTKACFMWKYLNKLEMFGLEAKEQGQTGGLLN